jgi:hypothetical protein
VEGCGERLGLRDGFPIEVPAEELVDGDLVLLGDGSQVSADLCLVSAQGGFGIAALTVPLKVAADAAQKRVARSRQGLVSIGAG